MARPRVPLMKAQITGRIARNPKRFSGRIEPTVTVPLGEPPKWLKTPAQKAAWKEFSDELPWLNGSHRAIVEIAATIRGRLMAGDDIGVKAMSLLRQCLGSMGGTPSDASKVSMPVKKQADPADKYFSS